jgi:hypothetical protein
MKFEGFSTENKHIARAITTSADTLPTDILKPRNERLAALGLGITGEDICPVYFASLVGVPADDKLSDYKNALFKLREDLIASPKFLMFSLDTLRSLTEDEVSFFDAVSRGDADETTRDFVNLININGDSLRTAEAKRIFAEDAEKLKDKSPDQLFSYGAKIITWLRRFTSSENYARFCTADIPVIMFYGKTGRDETEFMHFMSRAGFDVLYISSEKASLNVLKENNTDGRMQIFEFPYETTQFPYPDKAVKGRFATVAYSAEREFDEFMYSGNAVFKEYQFSDMKALTLKTTFEEIGILWHTGAKYRAGFDVIGGKTAVVPNIFAKISGVKDGNANDYFDSIREKLSPFTRIIYKSPSYDKYTQSVLTSYKDYYSGGEIFTDKLKGSQINPYNYLSDDLQKLIFRKMQEAADSGLLNLGENELVPLIIWVGLSLDKEILKMLQKFDYTGDIPKIIVIDTIEDTFSKVECIQLLLYNLLGFDILVYTPTGYRNLETYLSPNAFETYTMNEFAYNLHIPRFKIPDKVPLPKENSGLFNKLFKKGRK